MSGNVCSDAKEVFVDHVSDLLDLRKDECARAGLPGDAVWIPVEAQKRGEKLLREDWMASAAGRQRRADLASQSKDSQDRAMLAYYRRHMKEIYADAFWAHILMATGGIDDDIVCIVNDIYRERTLASTQGPQGVARRQLPRDQRGQRSTGPMQIQHHTSEGKALRRSAAALDKEIREQEEPTAAVEEDAVAAAA